MLDILCDALNSDKYVVRQAAYNITKAFIYHIDNVQLLKEEKRIKSAEVHRSINRLIELQKVDLYNLLGDSNGEKLDLSENCPFGDNFSNKYEVTIDNVRDHISIEIDKGTSYFKLKDQVRQFKRKYSEYPRVYNED